MTKFRILKPFLYSRDGLSGEALRAGDEIEIRADIVPGLISAGMIEVKSEASAAGAAEIRAASGDPVPPPAEMAQSAAPLAPIVAHASETRRRRGR